MSRGFLRPPILKFIFQNPLSCNRKRHRTLCSNYTGGYVLGVSSGLATDRGSSDPGGLCPPIKRTVPAPHQHHAVGTVRQKGCSRRNGCHKLCQLADSHVTVLTHDHKLLWETRLTDEFQLVVSVCTHCQHGCLMRPT